MTDSATLNAGDKPVTDQELSAMPTSDLVARATNLREKWFGSRLTYSPKVFLPLTQLCRNVCHYCTYAQTPSRLSTPYLSLTDVVETAKRGRLQGCREALFTLGEKPELRYRAASEWLAEHGYSSTVEYVAAAARAVLDETGLLPHINAGTLSADEIELLRPVSASMGIMLESDSDRLCERGMPHFGSPDKIPSERLATLNRMGVAKVPTTTGVLIGIGETEEERISALRQLSNIHARHGHIQEIIIQNFRAKANTKMADAPEPDTETLVRTIAQARLVFGPDVSIQVPPNLNKEDLEQIAASGINDLGGISPVTKDFVNPEADWPELDELADQMARMGRQLVPRLTIYPHKISMGEEWLASSMIRPVQELCDSENLARGSDWYAGMSTPPSAEIEKPLIGSNRSDTKPVSPQVEAIVDKAASGKSLTVSEIARLFEVREIRSTGCVHKRMHCVKKSWERRSHMS